MSIWKVVLLLGSALSLTGFARVSCASSVCDNSFPIDGKYSAPARMAGKIDDYPGLKSSTAAITGEMISIVIKYIHDDWKNLAQKLGLNTEEIQWIHDKHDYMSYCAEELMDMWLSQKLRTLGELATALGNAWRSDINDKLGACL